jgi:hypothetical protein
MGGPRSGSTWHVDPNATSAWNAVLAGSKKWLLYPPHALPPGVHPSPDGADVAAPVSLMEWFLNFYDATQEGKVGGSRAGGGAATQQQGGAGSSTTELAQGQDAVPA